MIGQLAVYIGFSTPNWFNPVSWLVRKFTGSSVSHTWIMFYDEYLGMNVIIEAHELGFRLIPFKRFQEHNKVVAMVDTLWPMRDFIKSQARWLGSMYDYAGLLGGLVVMLGRWLHLKWHNPFRNNKAMFCSESVVRALQDINYPGSNSLPPSDTTPQDLLNFLKAQNIKITYGVID